MGRLNAERKRWRWSELTSHPDYRGRWVALDEVRYHGGQSQPAEGVVVDVDEDLASLCARVQSAERPSCSIVYCDEGGSGIRRAAAMR